MPTKTCPASSNPSLEPLILTPGPNTHLQYPGLPWLLYPWQPHVTSLAISGGPPPPLLPANSACTLQTEDLQRNNSSSIKYVHMEYPQARNYF